MFITITIILASVPFPQKRMGSLIQPKLISHPLMMPLSLKRFEMYNSDINCGTAMEMTKIVRQNFFIFIPFLFIIMARNMPKK